MNPSAQDRDYAQHPMRTGPSGHDLPAVARGQRLMIASVALSYLVPWALTAIAMSGVVPAEHISMVAFAIVTLRVVLYVASVIAAAAGAVTVLKGVGSATIAQAFAALCILVPFFNLLTLLVVNSFATRALRAGGWTVGLVGATPPPSRAPGR